MIESSLETKQIESLDVIDQFEQDIIAYLDALKEETGTDNPDIIIDDLFAWTDPELHNELRHAIWRKTEENWRVQPIKTNTGDFRLALTQTANKFHYM